MNEQTVFNKIKQLSSHQGLIFGMTNFYRVKHFYRNFEEKYDLSVVDTRIGNNNCLNYLESTLSKLSQNYLSPSFFEDHLIIFDLAIVDDDYFGSSIENFTAQLVAIIAYDILKYRQEYNKEYLLNCVNNILEIINQNRSDVFSKLDSESNSDDLDNYLDRYFDIEFSVQNSLLDLVVEGVKEKKLIEFGNEYQLVFS